MSDLKFETIESAIALARRLEVAAAALRVLQAHPTMTSLLAVSDPMAAVFNASTTYYAQSTAEFQRAALAASVPVASA